MIRPCTTSDFIVDAHVKAWMKMRDVGCEKVLRQGRFPCPELGLGR
jgi:hypothetical protein